MTAREPWFPSLRATVSKWLDRCVWYNRNGAARNGIKWFRFAMGSRLEGWGLWWKDLRLAAPDPDPKVDAPDNKYHVGPYWVALLRPDPPESANSQSVPRP